MNVGTDQARRYKNQLQTLVRRTKTKQLSFIACSSHLSLAVMVQSDKVEVYITRHKDDRRFKEYRAPIGSRTYSPDLNEVYIEAVNDERFTVCVRLLRGFDWKGCANVQVKCTMDGKSQVGYIRKKPSNKSRELRRLLQLASIHQTIGGETVLCGLTFRELDIGTSVDCL